jgi:hypothetical protein
MTDFATKFLEAKSSEEFGSLVCDVIRGTPSGIDPILALISFAAEMAMRSPSKSQRAQVATYMRLQATAVDAGPQ